MTENARDPGVLDPYAAGFTAWLSARGYAPSTVEQAAQADGPARAVARGRAHSAGCPG